jgi:hypothetical protein
MIRFSVAIICMTMFTGMCVAQKTATLRIDGPADPLIRGNLAGFQPIHRVWPNVRTDLPNGARVTITSLIAHGAPLQVLVRESSADTKATAAFIAALKKWRFAMPADGTSPVSFTVTWKAMDGKFVVLETHIAIVRKNPAREHQPASPR